MGNEALVYEALRRGILDPEAAVQLTEEDPGLVAVAKQAPGVLARGLASGGQGVLRGLAGAVDFGNWLAEKTAEWGAGKSLPEFPSLVKEVKESQRIYQPKEPWEKYIASGAEGAAGFLPTTKLQLLAGVLAGTGAQAGEDLLKNYTSPEAARFLGSLPATALSIPLAMKRPQIVKVAQEPLQELGPGGIARAWETAKGAEQTLGAPAGFWQGASSPTAVKGLAESLARTGPGAPLRQIMEAQQPIGRAASETFVEGLSRGMGTQEEANAVLAAGKEVLGGKKAVVAAAVKPLYEKAARDVIDPAGIRDAINQALVDAQIPGASIGGKATKRIEKILAEYAGKRVPVSELRVVANEFRDAAQKAFAAEQGTKGKALQIASDAINSYILPASPALREATAAYRGLTEGLIDPIRESSWTSMFPKEMRKSGFGDFEKFARALDGAAPSDIAQLGTRLRMVDRQAFPSVVKEWWKGKLEETLKPREGYVAGDVLNDFPKAIAGAKGTAQREQFQAIMGQIALAQGREPANVIAAADRLMDSLMVYSRGQGNLGRLADAAEKAGQNLPASLLESFGLFYPIRRTGRQITEMVSRRTMTKLSELFTDPDRMDELIKIAKYEPWSPRFRQALRGALGEGVVSEVRANPGQNTEE